VKIREGGRILVAMIAIVALLAPASALAGEKLPKPPDTTPAAPPPPSPAPPEQQKQALKLDLRGAKGGKVRVGHRLRILGTVSPWRAGQEVTVTVQRGNKAIKEEVVPVTHAGAVGQFGSRSPVLVEPGHYAVTAELTDGAARAGSDGLKIKYPTLNRGNRGKHVKIFNRVLDKQGYVPSRGRKFTERTGRAVLTYRKVHGMARTMRGTSGMFKKLAAGRGAYKLRRPGAGKHVEVSVGRQVMVLADNGKAQRTYPVSTGKSSTPTVRGHFRFYRRQPGFNSIGMYYSVYFHRGYAIHGYRSVPARYPASHGCVRSPIPDAHSIYNWVRLGMSIYVY
jgi:L,D-transpeptidase catalytic domain